METECEDHSVEKIHNGIKKKEDSMQIGRRYGKTAVGKVVPRQDCRL